MRVLSVYSAVSRCAGAVYSKMIFDGKFSAGGITDGLVLMGGAGVFRIAK